MSFIVREVFSMSSTSTTAKLEIGGLGKQKMMALAAKAKRLGLSPARYVKQLVEDDLAIESRAQSMNLAQIMAQVRKEVSLRATASFSRNAPGRTMRP